MQKLLSAAVSVLFFSFGAQAQDWHQIQQLYQSGMYSQAVRLLEDNASPQAQAYRALCSLQMRLDNARAQASAFLQRCPDNLMAPQVRWQLALDYFDSGQYEAALDQFGELSAESLYPSQRAEYMYKLGYCAFSVQEWDRAVEWLEKAAAQPCSDYTAPAHFTLGYIAYARQQFPQAARWFGKSAGDSRFATLSRFYLLECRFNEKDYAYVAENGEQLYGQVPQERRPHLARILSESFLILGDVEKAGKYYDQNLRNSSEPTRSDRYYAGVLNYLREDWAAAVDNFTRMGDRADSLGQIASYQLGYSYVQLKNKVSAMEAFRQAAGQSWSEDIREDAFYNYAKLAFDLGRDTAPFQEYLSRYGTARKGDQVYSYMAMAALQNHDYEAAVAAYDQLDELDSHMQSNYMKAYFLRARELMEMGSWRNAVPHLKAASFYTDRRDGFNQLTRYYLAEAYYRDGKYDDARTLLTELYNLSALRGRPEGELIPYQTAYTYFKEADYEKALKWFRTYLSGKSLRQGADAQTRVADCYFFTGDYAQAMQAYERQMSAYPNAKNLYPRYRAGVAAGLLENNARKVEFLKDAPQAGPQAPWYGESLYELGRAYVALGNEAEAVRSFTTLSTTTSDPALQARSLLELGMIARNAGRGQEALDYYKKVVDRGGEYAEDALLAIESIYRTREDPEAYLAYVNSLGDKANRTEAQKEEVYFSSAEQMYLSGDFTKAQTALQAYLEKYPEAAYRAKASFYLADCARHSGNKEQACDLYRQALDQGLEGSLWESATLQTAALQYELGSYAEAFGAYVQLGEKAQMPENLRAARLGRMRSAFKARQWSDALVAGQEVLAQTKGDAALQREARWICAKSLLSSSRREEALREFRILAKEPSTGEGAEASYILIQDQYDRGDFASVQDKVYAFAEKAGGQNYWLAKAFIVLGDTFVEQGNLAQARATFESIRSGYTSSGAQDDVLDQVEIRLRKL